MPDRATPPDPNSWREEPTSCPLCGETRPRSLGRRGGLAHRARLGSVANVVRCRDCHLVYCSPALKPLDNPYAVYTGGEYFAGKEQAAKIESGRKLAGKAQALLGRTGNLLELGCGRGELLLAAAEAGWFVQGVEMTAQFASEAASRGIPIESSSIETSVQLDRQNQFDVVYLAAVLEHLYDPVACLQRIHRALTPGGLVFIDVPNECSLRTRIGNLYMRLRGRDWAVNLSPTFPPFHVVGFCPKSLRRALAMAGFEIAELEVVRWPDALPSRDGGWGALEGAGSRVVNALADAAGDGDGIVCWARKPISP